jgi:hypothetical protein
MQGTEADKIESQINGVDAAVNVAGNLYTS